MKQLFVIILVLTMLSVPGCKKKGNNPGEYTVEMIDRYSSLAEFRSSLDVIDSLVHLYNIKALLDTLPNGFPDPEGEAGSFFDIFFNIKMEFDKGNIEKAVYDVYHFDGTPFSVISYLMKAEMVGLISPLQLAQILVQFQLPPFPVPNFSPPKAPVLQDPPIATCPCDPRIKIRVSWSYKAPCGNYSTETSGYAAGNKLTNMREGTWFQLDAEIHGCACGGQWHNTITPVGLTSHASSSANPQSVGLIAYSPGEYQVMFDYTCGCGCNKTDTKTFTITFN